MACTPGWVTSVWGARLRPGGGIPSPGSPDLPRRGGLPTTCFAGPGPRSCRAGSRRRRWCGTRSPGGAPWSGGVSVRGAGGPPSPGSPGTPGPAAFPRPDPPGEPQAGPSELSSGACGGRGVWHALPRQGSSAVLSAVADSSALDFAGAGRGADRVDALLRLAAARAPASAGLERGIRGSPSPRSPVLMRCRPLSCDLIGRAGPGACFESPVCSAAPARSPQRGTLPSCRGSHAPGAAGPARRAGDATRYFRNTP